MESLTKHKIEGIPVIQNQQEFIIGVFSIRQFFKFTRFTERLLVGFDENSQPLYNNEVQRTIEQSRVKSISKFLINDPEATFPTNIVLHIPIEAIEKQESEKGKISIYLKDSVFQELGKKEGDVFITIIDGQHRIKGIEMALSRLKEQLGSLQQVLSTSVRKDLEKDYEKLSQRYTDLLEIQLVVTFFIDKTLEYQAMIFSTINRTQKRVSQNLVYSLFGLTTEDSPQKTALQVVLKLNAHPKSPFFRRIKLYGGGVENYSNPPLSQAMMVKAIIGQISESLREANDNDRYLERKKLFKRSPGSNKVLIFRDYYAGNKDSMVSDVLFYFFNAVKNVFRSPGGESYWEIGENNVQSNIFHTSVGFDSLFKIMIEILKREGKVNIIEKGMFAKHLEKASHLNLNDISKFSFNNRGKKILFLEMSLLLWEPDYIKNPKDLRESDLRNLLKSD